MKTVFVAGSISLKRLHPLFVKRLSAIVSSGMNVVVGDANGVDRSIQESLCAMNAVSVTVYCSGDQPRNNVGNWPVHNVFPEKAVNSRACFTAKDLVMADDADYGLMMWDSKSTGTLSNVIELVKRHKKCAILVNKNKYFIDVGDVDGIENLIYSMSNAARIKAENKIGLSSKVNGINHGQLHLAL